MAKFDWSKLKEDVKKTDEKKSFVDDRFWKPKADEKGNGLFIIRFLPDPDNEVWSKFYSHNFEYNIKGQKKYWIKKCINTFGFDKECPICTKNMEYWNSAYESDKKLARVRGRKLQFISNILVIKDPSNTENEGKVFLYQYGKKIYDKIVSRINPSEQDLEDSDFISFIPFCPDEGANFKLKVSKQGEFPNYDASEFSVQTKLQKSDEILKKCYKLSEFTDPKDFPSNEETIKVLGPLLGLVKDTTTKETVSDTSFSHDENITGINLKDLDDDLKMFEDM